MFESKQNQPKLDPNQEKHLIINPSGLLDTIVTSRVQMEDDLVLRQLEEGVFSILKDGKRISEHFDKLTTEHGYALVIYSNRTEHQIIHALEELDVACKREGLKGFPKITAILVKDQGAYQTVRASDPKVVEGCRHGILVAGYSMESQQEVEILEGCSKLLHFSKLEQNSYIVLDNRPSFVKNLRQEGWNIYNPSSNTFNKILYELCQKPSEPKNEKLQENLEEDTEEEKNAEIYFPEVGNQKDLKEKSNDAFVKPTTNNLDKIKKEKAESNEFEEFKDFSLNDLLLPSNLKFKVVEGTQPRGSSPSLRWFVDEATNSKWVGKCSSLEIYKKNHFYEYKEFLGSLIYRLLGVRTPKIVFSEQIIGKEIQDNIFFGTLDLSQPRIHLMSSVVPGFELLGDQFLEDYKASSRRNKKQLYYIKKGNRPLIGFGQVVAVSILIHDFDFVGNSGRGIGCIPIGNGEYFEILKIDPGESLSFAYDMSGAKELDNPPSKREALAGTLGQRINFDDLNEFDKRECVETLKEILSIKVSTLEKLFTPFLNVDKKFRIIFEGLLNRRKELLAAFCWEVGSLIERYIGELEEQQAAEQMSKWGKPPLHLSPQREKKGQLIINKAQLEAFTAATETNTTDTKILQAAPYRKVTFVGRESEMSQIKKLFSCNTGIIGCAIVGGPGLGKSQLVTEYIIRNQREMYSEIVWLHAEQSDLIIDQMQIYLETCYKVKFDPEDKDMKAAIFTRFYRILEKEEEFMNKSSKKPCIVFDNADSMAQIADYLPNNKTYTKLKIDIIVTSRYKKWVEPLDTMIEMQPFETEETKNYIKSYFSLSGVAQDHNQLSIDAQRLNELVGGLPIALSLAVAYIQQKGLSISDFCNFVAQENNNEFIFTQSQKISEKESASEKYGDESKSMNFVSTILTLALADIRSKNYGAEPVLDILAYLSPDNISIALLKDCCMQCNQKKILNYLSEKGIKPTSEKSSDQLKQEITKELLNFFNAHEEKNQMIGVESLDVALELLLSYSIIIVNPIQNEPNDSENTLIQDTKTNNIKVHQLTQQVTRLNHQKSGVYESIYENVFEWIVDKLHYNEKEMKDVRRAAFLIPHAIHLEGLQSSIKDHKKTELQELIGKHQLYGVGNYDIALKYYQKALAIKTNCYESDHPSTAATLTNIGNVWGFLGDYEKQKDLLTRALDIFEKHYGKDHPETGITLSNLGNAWGSLGDYEKQKDLLTRALDIFETHYGKDHPQTGITLTNLGNAWGSLGDTEKQKDLLTRALIIIEKHYGKDHPQTGITLRGLGNSLGSLGNYEKQKDLLTRTLEIFEEHYGKDHPHTGIILDNLGNAWGSLGDYEKHKDLLTKALVINEKHYGKDHPQTGITLTSLGNAWGSLGDYEKQKDLLTRALVIKEKHYGKDHPQTGITLESLGNAWGSLGDYEKQKDLLTRALVIEEKHYGKNHPQTGITLTNLGNAWGSLGDYEKQKDLLTRALVIKEKHYGKDHPQTGITLESLGNAWGSLGDYEKQKDLLTRALVIEEKHYGKNHPQTGITLTNLGNAWGSLGDYEKQKDLLTRALVIKEKHYSKDHPQTGITLGSLGNVWGDLGDYKKQKDLLTRALAIDEKHHGKDHPQTSITLTDLGNAWGSLGNYEKQKDLLTRALVIKEKHYGKDHPQTGITLGSLGNAWGSLGDYEKQKDLLTRALVIKEKHYGKDHPQTGITLGSLGNAWGSLGDYEKQKDLLTRARVIKEKYYGKNHPQTGITLTNLGKAWGPLGDYEKQKDLLTRALEIFEKHFDKDHPQTGITLGSLGNAWGDLGDYKKQKDLLTRALAIDENHYGKDHPQSGITLSNLGNAWGSLGNYEKQKDLLTRALEIFEKHFDKDHPQTGITLGSLGNAWGNLGDTEKQKDLLTRARDIFEKHYGKDHPQTGFILTNLGNAWGDLGDYEKQKDLFTRALAINEKHYGKDHPQTCITLIKLGNAWGSLGDYEKQRDLLTRALVINEKHYGRDHPSTGNVLNYLGSAMGKLGDYEKQIDLLYQTLKIKQKHCGNDHPQTCIVLDNLGNAWGQLGEYEKQKDFLITALEIKQKIYGEDHPQTGLTLSNLANAWEGLGNYVKQKDLLIRALEIKEKYYGKDHLNTGITLGNLGRAWGQLGEHKKQIDLLSRALEIFEKYFGKDHIHTGITLYHLGDACRVLGDYKKQRDLLVLALQIFEKHHGKDHPQTIPILENLADAWQQLGNYEEHKEILARATKLQQKQVGRVVPTTKRIQFDMEEINIPIEDMSDIRSTTKDLGSNSDDRSSQSLKSSKKDSKLTSEGDFSSPSGSKISEEKFNNNQITLEDGYISSTNRQRSNTSSSNTNSEIAS